MHSHTTRIQGAIDEDDHQTAWRLIHDFENWCYERIEFEDYSPDSAGTLLSAPQTFFIRILKKEKKYKQMLIHLIYQAGIDSRDLKAYPRLIQSCFRKCQFTKTSVSTALSLYEQIKLQEFNGAYNFLEIRNTVGGWE